MQSAPNSKSTPNRRRTTPGRSRNAAQKVHASDNDIPSQTFNNTKRPSTPKKIVASGTIAPQTQSAGPKQKNKNSKNRNAKNGVTPTTRRQQDRDSPSLGSQDALAPIFAGSTFHASPAPSDLPLPSFLSLSNGESPMAKAKTSSDGIEDSPPSTDSEEDSPRNQPVPGNEESPLEFFFRADRAEKARVRRASSANTGSVQTTPFCPLQDSPFKECNTFPKAMPQNSHRHPMPTQKNASPGIYSSGPDSCPRLPLGPAFSTPYQDRIRAARSTQNPAHATQMANRIPNSASTEALKQYFFNGQSSRLAPEKSTPLHSTSSQVERLCVPRSTPQVAQLQHSASAFGQLAPNQESQRVPPSTPYHLREVSTASPLTSHPHQHQTLNSSIHMRSQSDSPSKHIDALEGNLRRILKLDSPS
ncbi:hypothetical protein GGS21DRAFT_192022 [Xylaria nigripes]|nr:hypothetical protein GGS21DRAFT_192022 [Xylaria nigripes]